MSETNGTPTTHSRLKEQRAQNALRRAEIESKLLESFGFWTAPWGPSPFDGAPGAYQQWIPLGPQGGLGGRKGDRDQGSDRPFLWNDIDLVRSRSVARWLCATNMLAQGAVRLLVNYIAKTGYTYEAQPGRRFSKDGIALDLAEQVQDVIDEFQSLNVLGETVDERLTWADREREAVWRRIRDGEVFLRTFDQGDGSTLVRFVEPEQIQEPPGGGQEWKWGIETPPGDVEQALCYAVSYATSEEWEPVYVGEMSHLKANTDATVKRGLSDFYSTGPALEEVQKLLRFMRAGAIPQASIAWIEQHSGANQAGLDALVAKRRDLATSGTLTDPLSGRNLDSQSMQPGQRLMVGGNRQFLPPPQAVGASVHIQIVQAGLRAIGTRWNMTESMISGDASNANMASMLIAGSPFVTGIECEQAAFGRFFTRVFWQAIRNAARAGRFRYGGRTYEWEEISRLVDILPTPPGVAIADKTAEATIDKQDLETGVVSKQIIRAKRGYDNEQVRQDLKEEPVQLPPQPQQGPPQPQQPGGMGAKFERCVKDVKKDGNADNPWAVCNASVDESQKGGTANATPFFPRLRRPG